MRPFPIYAERGEGCRVWDVDGVERIDCDNNFTALIHGHAHPAIVAAVADQAARGLSFGLPTLSEVELAELLCERLPAVEQVRFTNSGTEAVMMALKAARAATGRSLIAKVEGAYHGAYDHAEVSLDPNPNAWGRLEAPESTAYAAGTPPSVLDDTLVLPFNNPAAAAELIARHRHDLAAILVDAMPNRAGLSPATPEFLAALREGADDAGALVVLDEVITFRLGLGGAQGLHGLRPDLTTLGKIIGGGLPVGAVGGSVEAMSVFDPTLGKPALPHGGTFAANPMAMTAGLAAMRLLDTEAFDRLAALGAQLRQGLVAAFAAAGLAAQVNGAGSLLRVHFKAGPVVDYRSAYATPREAAIARAFHRGLINRGVLAGANGLMSLSTAMQPADVEAVIAAAEGAAREIVRLGDRLEADTL
ncbi:MAG: aspartate aminotransferase family protein [Phenylobacterium zucineum]|nr:MAG: aspartate aminotransferase family protein [Phenylobacterium zucineum]